MWQKNADNIKNAIPIEDITVRCSIQILAKRVNAREIFKIPVK
tara:strand:+ start:260 stop:388 length:129 start_codon:yes stop_codon:yes gene_type:complete